MKKLLICLLSLLLLVACSSNEVIDKNEKEKYLDMVKQLQSREEFVLESELFDLTFDISKTNDAYRFYIIVDNSKMAMYDICMIAVEKDVDYENNMAANIGIFEENDYSLIPGQYNPSKGFMKGISISGLSLKENPTIYLLIEWNNKDMSKTYREYIQIDAEAINE